MNDSEDKNNFIFSKYKLERYLIGIYDTIYISTSLASREEHIKIPGKLQSGLILFFYLFEILIKYLIQINGIELKKWHSPFSLYNILPKKIKEKVQFKSNNNYRSFINGLKPNERIELRKRHNNINFSEKLNVEKLLSGFDWNKPESSKRNTGPTIFVWLRYDIYDDFTDEDIYDVFPILKTSFIHWKITSVLKALIDCTDLNVNFDIKLRL